MKKLFELLGVLLLVIVLSVAAWIAYVSSKISIKDLGVQETMTADYIAIEKPNVQMKDYPIVMKDAFEKLEKVVKENTPGNFGKSFSIYQKLQGAENYNLIMGYEIFGDNTTISDNDVIMGSRPSIKARTFEMTGRYKYLAYAWMYAMFKTGFDIDETKISYETYDITYGSGVPENKFVTTIHIPVK